MLEAIKVSEPDSRGHDVYRVHKDGIAFAAIVYIETSQGGGWRVNNWVPGRRGSRVLSETPQQAAQRYFGKLVSFPG